MDQRTALNACATLLHKGDPDRFRVAMAAPLPAREKLLPLYAFNLEVARAPWASSEPMIAQMRLQFWRDVLDDIAAGNPPRAHEVATPLAQVLPAALAADLQALVNAREWDIARTPFDTADKLWAYLDHTAGRLMWVSGALLEADETLRDDLHRFGRGVGLTRFMQARAALSARGADPIQMDEGPLYDQARKDLRIGDDLRMGSFYPALLDGAASTAILNRLIRGKPPELNPAYLALRFAFCRIFPRFL